MADKSNNTDSPTQNNDEAANPEAPQSALVESEDESDDHHEGGDTEAADGDGPSASKSATKNKKKKSKRNRLKDALTGGSSEASNSGGGTQEEQFAKVIGGMSDAQVSTLLAMNPALAQQIGAGDGDISGKQALAALKKLNLEDVMTGLAASGKNAKDMASYKFWQTQPVSKFGEKDVEEEGPVKVFDPALVAKEPGPLIDGFEWVTMNMEDEGEVKEVFELLYGHYVEDEEAMFRFNYSESFFKWALLSPGWQKEWHVGVRASASRKLLAFISAIPITLRVRQKTLDASEVNFLCVHKKLRSKRLAPVLIKEITRRCNLEGVWQAIYTAGVVLPKPVSTCRYFHRSIDWPKLHEVKFSPLPKNSKPAWQIRKYALPENTSTKGLRPMAAKDIDGVLDLLQRFLAKFDMAPVFKREEVDHWLFHKPENYKQQVIWSYVVEDPTSKKLTDFFSFYCLESSVINNPKHNNVRAAYLYYYASEMGIAPMASVSDYKTRLNTLMNDALILAKKFRFDVFNALTLMDNTLFLEPQKFGGGDGQLHYYLYNYRANPIAGGVDKTNAAHEGGSGVGVVML